MTSKSTINKVGVTLRTMPTRSPVYTEALSTLHSWRADHVKPTNAIRNLAQKIATKCARNEFLVVQRLKRTPTIINKLERYPTMELSRMQDISGCRLIFKSMQDLNDAFYGLINSNSRSKVKRIYNYIQSPKQSGYRGVHVVFEYEGSNTTTSIFNKSLVEVQLRTEIQHAWATTVEILGTFLNQALKFEVGDDKWLRFFAVAGLCFDQYENYRYYGDESFYDNQTELIEISDALDPITKLKAFRATVDWLGKSKGRGRSIAILHIKPDEHVINPKLYKSSDFFKANLDYIGIEEDIAINNKNEDVVLIELSDISNLVAAYPNYFGDSLNFQTYLEKVMGLSPWQGDLED